MIETLSVSANKFCYVKTCTLRTSLIISLFTIASAIDVNSVFFCEAITLNDQYIVSLD